jgi:hypothetical protein
MLDIFSMSKRIIFCYVLQLLTKKIGTKNVRYFLNEQEDSRTNRTTNNESRTLFSIVLDYLTKGIQ